MTVEAIRQSKPLRNMISLLTAGSGFGVTYILYELVKTQPQAVIAGLIQWGPMFVVCAGMLLVFDRRGGEFIAATRESAQSNQKLADAVSLIAQKDDVASRERDLLLNDVASRLRSLGDAIARVEACQVKYVRATPELPMIPRGQ